VKLCKSPSKIVGVRVGEIEANLLNTHHLKVRFALLRDPEGEEGPNAGSYLKDSQDSEFSPEVLIAFKAFIDALEESVLVELFQVEDNRLANLDVVTPEEEDGGLGGKKDAEVALSFPTLGGRKGTPQL